MGVGRMLFLMLLQQERLPNATNIMYLPSIRITAKSSDHIAINPSKSFRCGIQRRYQLFIDREDRELFFAAAKFDLGNFI